MSHLTDGQLNAYLDGSVEALDGATLVEARSHIAVCDDCSARLEAARLVRDEAASLLARAAPSAFSPPPFEELQRRAASVDPAGTAVEPMSGGGSETGSRATRGRLFRQPGSLAWAASLTVALTAGWLARGMVSPGIPDRPALMAPGESVALQERREVSALGRSDDRVAAESLERSVAGEVGDEMGDEVADDEGSLRSATRPSAELPSEPKEGRAAEAAPSPGFYARDGAEAEEEGADRRRLDRIALNEATTETAGEEAALADDRPVELEANARRFEMGNREAAPESELQQALEPEPERAAAKMARQDAAGPPSEVFRAGESPPGWQPVSRELAEALVGGTLKTVEGLPVLSVYVRAVGGATEVWTAQQLGSGHQLNLLQKPLGDGRFSDLEEGRAANEEDRAANEEDGQAPADPASESEARPRQQAYYETLESLLVDGFLIEARAPLAPDSLRVLLSRLKD